MVGTRMEGKVDSVEKNVGEMKGNVAVLQGEVTEIKRDVNSLKEWVLEIKDKLARLEKKNTDVNELDRSDGSGSHGGGGNNEQHVGEPNGKERREAGGGGGVYGREGIELASVVTRMTIQSWGEFKKELLRRFHQSQQGNNYEVLMSLKQEDSVAEYREKFEFISAPL
ncbi:Retrotransposable element Tf2 [Senna tora]|uniref:Retrotransposable element Tf2 n=1 Tax=Senna tora TaxID=362788 RepID=A0A834T9S0_9FABA|nr:Retrotransposable element Tf2 [Senna tora]